MKFRLLVAALLLSIVAKAQNITPAHLKAADDVLTAMHLDTTLKATTKAMLEQASTRLPEDKRPRFMQVMNTFMAKYVNYSILHDQMASMYAQEFTEKELKDLAQFYRSPLGQKVIQKMPQMTQKGMALGQQAVQAHQAELQQMMEQAFKDQQ